METHQTAVIEEQFRVVIIYVKKIAIKRQLEVRAKAPGRESSADPRFESFIRCCR